MKYCEFCGAMLEDTAFCECPKAVAARNIPKTMDVDLDQFCEDGQQDNPPIPPNHFQPQQQAYPPNYLQQFSQYQQFGQYGNQQQQPYQPNTRYPQYPHQPRRVGVPPPTAGHPYQQYPQYQPYPPPYPPPYQPPYPRPLRPPGKMMVKVSGILLTIFGSIGLLGMIITFSMFAIMFAALSNLNITIGQNAYGTFFAYMLYSLVCTILTFSFGIYGIGNGGIARKGNTIVCMGIILIVLQVITLFASIFLYNYIFDSIYSSITDTTRLFTQSDLNLYNSLRSGSFFTGTNAMSAAINAAIGCVLPILYVIGGMNSKKNDDPLM